MWTKKAPNKRIRLGTEKTPHTLYNALAVFQLVMIACVAFAVDPYLDVYSQSAATPMYTIRWDVGQPAVWPIWSEKLRQQP